MKAGKQILTGLALPLATAELVLGLARGIGVQSVEESAVTKATRVKVIGGIF